MSLYALGIVSQWKDVTPQIIAVGFHLANCHNAETNDCYPSIKYLSSKTSLSERSIQRILSEMEEMRLLHRENKFNEIGRQTTNNYRFLPLFSENSRGDTDDTHRGDTHDTDGGDTHVTGEGDTHVTQKQEVIKQEDEPFLLSGQPDDDEPSEADVCKTIIQHLNDKTGRNFKPVDANTKLIKARLREGHSAEDIAAVIDRQTELWQHDDRMRQYLRPSTLFNATKFNDYVGQINEATPRPSQPSNQTERFFSMLQRREDERVSRRPH